MWHTYPWSNILCIPVTLLLYAHNKALQLIPLFWMKAVFVWLSNKVKGNAASTWQCVSEPMCPSWGKLRLPNFSLKHRSLILTSGRAQVEGSPNYVKNATDHHSECFFFSFCHGCRQRGKQTPKVSIISLRPRGQKKSHYISCHANSLSRCGRDSAHQLWCDTGDPEYLRRFSSARG